MENSNEISTPAAETVKTAAAPGKDIAWEREMIEKMLAANLKEQRAGRRWGIFFKLVVIVMIFALFGLMRTDLSSSETVPAEPHAALIRISGPILGDSKVSAENVIKAVQKAFAEKNTVGIILRINSPGGSPVQAGRIHDEILRLRQVYPNKPLHVVVDEVCASGGYYIAVAADNIYVDKASVVGSIGVMINGFGFTELINKIGVERRLLTSGKNKGFMDPFSPQNEQQKQYAQNLIDEVHQQFITVVKNGRGDRLAKNSDVFSGLIWTGSKAIELGLADELGNVDSVARNVLKTQSIVDYTEEERLSERLFKRLGVSMGEGVAKYGSEAFLPTLK